MIFPAVSPVYQNEVVISLQSALRAVPSSCPAFSWCSVNNTPLVWLNNWYTPGAALKGSIYRIGQGVGYTASWAGLGWTIVMVNVATTSSIRKMQQN